MRDSNGRKCLFFYTLILLISGIVANIFVHASETPSSCSIFTVSIGNTVFFGNNEDSQKIGTYMWVVPAQNIETDSGTVAIHGVVAFGYNYNDDPSDGYAQGGINDQGLCADGNVLPSLSLNSHPERESMHACCFELEGMSVKNL